VKNLAPNRVKTLLIYCHLILWIPCCKYVIQIQIHQKFWSLTSEVLGIILLHKSLFLQQRSALVPLIFGKSNLYEVGIKRSKRHAIDIVKQTHDVILYVIIVQVYTFRWCFKSRKVFLTNWYSRFTITMIILFIPR
jgi:hypothetical protein